jgi:hypothetical protein
MDFSVTQTAINQSRFFILTLVFTIYWVQMSNIQSGRSNHSCWREDGVEELGSEDSAESAGGFFNEVDSEVFGFKETVAHSLIQPVNIIDNFLYLLSRIWSLYNDIKGTLTCLDLARSMNFRYSGSILSRFFSLFRIISMILFKVSILSVYSLTSTSVCMGLEF